MDVGFVPFLPFKVNFITLNGLDFHLLLYIALIIDIKALECIERLIGNEAL